ncbi:hypothetical protein GCM10022251_16580 [Phytohabitans flavus]
MLNLVFESSKPHVEALDADRFHLYADGDRYPLPDAVLYTEPGVTSVTLQEVRITDITHNALDRELLRGEVRTQWESAVRMAGDATKRHVLVEDRGLTAALVAAMAATTGGTPLELVVTWRYAYADKSGVQAAPAREVRLTFAARNEAPPARPRGPFPDPDAVRLGVPAALRHRSGRPSYGGFVAVDFGTSASTITALDTRRPVMRPVDLGQARRLRSHMAAILRANAPAELSGRWQEQLDEIRKQVTIAQPDVAHLSLTEVADRLDGGSRGDGGARLDALLDSVCVAVEGRLAEADDALRKWLAPRVLEAYDDAFRVPALDTLRMRPVVFDKDTGATEIASAVSIKDDRELDIELPSRELGAMRQLKARLTNRKPIEGRFGRDGREATTDDVIAHVYLRLAEAAEHFLSDDEDRDLQLLSHLVVTYPTTTPPEARTRLRRIVGHCLDLDKVVTNYDEGVAAALFFLMRDFGGARAEFGAEGLRARSRQVATDPPTWHQNMLVVDIGAGTTDIALLRLTLIDRTPAVAGGNETVRGKYYVLLPEVLNSTGHPQLGGDFLTLRVFHWLKASIVDALLFGPGHPQERAALMTKARQALGLSEGELAPFAPQVVDHDHHERPVPPDVEPVLREILNTQWAENAPPSARNGFYNLWEVAEQAKIALGRLTDEDDHWPVGAAALESAFGAINPDQSRTWLKLLPEEGLRLSRADFVGLIRPVLSQAVGLAGSVVRHSLDPASGERLDRVMLSGKTSLMPLMRQVVAEELSAAAADPKGEAVWNPASVTVEAEFAKEAASMGACWAHSIVVRETGVKGDDKLLNLGRTVVTIDVENLFHSLPSSFSLLRVDTYHDALLNAGMPLREVDSSGRLAARVEWSDERPWPALPQYVDIHRPGDSTRQLQWGVFRFENVAKSQSFQYDPEIWLPSADGTGGGARICFQLEVDQGLTPRLHLSNGKPHYYVPGQRALEIRDFLDSQWWDRAEGRLRGLPASVWVVGRASKGNPSGAVELFPAWLSGSDEPTAAYFPEFFHEQPGLDSEPVPGRISAELPPAPANRDYRFFLRLPGGGERELGDIQATVSDGRTSRHVVTLDVRGRLELHRGYPSFLTATTLRDVQDCPGAVYRTEMEPGERGTIAAWDPYTGKH